MLRYLPFLLILAVWIFAFIDVLNTPEKEVRKLPKLAWAFVVLLFGQVLVGPIAWFVVGRPRKNAPYGAVRPQERRWVAPDDNPDFLNSLKNQPSSPATEEAPHTGSSSASSSEEVEEANHPTAPEAEQAGGGRERSAGGRATLVERGRAARGRVPPARGPDLSGRR